MWKKPWGYKEGIVICIALAVVGILLQGTAGKIDWEYMAWPVNIILLSVYLALLMIMHLTRKTVYLFSWMSSYTAAVSAMLAVVVLTVVMGLTRQLPAQQAVTGPEAWLGFSRMLSAWPFVLLFTWLISLLGMTIAKRLCPFRWQRLPFFFSHLGLFIAITGAVAGSGDIQRLKMTTTVGKAEWRAYDDRQQLCELPLAIELTDFTIDEYPPKLMLIGNETGKALPEGKPEHFLLEEEAVEGHLQDWKIRVVCQIPEAASVSTADTLKFVEFRSIGATYAAYVQVANVKSGQQTEGWVSCGSFVFPYKALRLTDSVSLVIPEREPRRFASDVKIYTQSGTKLQATIEVNHPLGIEGWKIYQLSYDESKGKWSDVSVFELVRDPWLPVVYTGIWMLIAGAVWMFITAAQRKEEQV